MMNTKFIKTISAALLAVLIIMGCRKREVLGLENYVVFETTAQGITNTENSLVVKVKAQRSVTASTAIEINVAETNISYGTKYTTTPAINNGKLILTIPSGNNETSFTITKTPNVLFDGDEKLVFELFSSASPLLIGATKQFTLTFAELIAANSTMVINGGGANFGNKVFIDLSANRQTAVQRINWDFGFYMNADDNRIILNSSTNMMVKQLNKIDMNAVTVADTIGISGDIAFSQTAPTTTSLPYIDYPNGDLTRTAISAVSAIDADNKVYIVNLGNGIGVGAASRGWKKIRVLRTSNGYALQHADISATSFSTITITKDDTYFFKYASLQNGVVTIEPQKRKWDIAWTYFANTTNFGAGEVPYLFQDIILLNRNVQAVRVMTSTKAFADFGEADLGSLIFLSTQNAIGADWRSGGGPTSAPAVRTDRYYIIKDSYNNYYKIRFTALTQAGERGYPAYEAILVKKG